MKFSLGAQIENEPLPFGLGSIACSPLAKFSLEFSGKSACLLIDSGAALISVESKSTPMLANGRSSGHIRDSSVNVLEDFIADEHNPAQEGLNERTAADSMRF